MGIEDFKPLSLEEDDPELIEMERDRLARQTELNPDVSAPILGALDAGGNYEGKITVQIDTPTPEKIILTRQDGSRLVVVCEAWEAGSDAANAVKTFNVVVSQESYKNARERHEDTD